MEIELVIEEGTVLSLRVEGLQGFLRVSEGARAGAAVARGESQPGTSGGESGVPGKRRRGRPRKSEEERYNRSLFSGTSTGGGTSIDSALAVGESPAAYGSSTGSGSAGAGSDVPLEIYNLPKKHQDFYMRKYAEFHEIYPTEKARELALEAVRGVAGRG